MQHARRFFMPAPASSCRLGCYDVCCGCSSMHACASCVLFPLICLCSAPRRELSVPQAQLAAAEEEAERAARPTPARTAALYDLFDAPSVASDAAKDSRAAAAVDVAVGAATVGRDAAGAVAAVMEAREAIAGSAWEQPVHAPIWQTAPIWALPAQPLFFTAPRAEAKAFAKDAAEALSSEDKFSDQ
jgi:hypothetical protein